MIFEEKSLRGKEKILEIWCHYLNIYPINVFRKVTVNKTLKNSFNSFVRNLNLKSQKEYRHQAIKRSKVILVFNVSFYQYWDLKYHFQTVAGSTKRKNQKYSVLG